MKKRCQFKRTTLQYGPRWGVYATRWRCSREAKAVIEYSDQVSGKTGQTANVCKQHLAYGVAHGAIQKKAK